MTDGAAAPATGPRPGSLEWLAADRPDACAVLDADAGRSLSRGDHARHADALADALAACYDVGPGTRVALRLAPGPDLLTLTYALAKLGAAPLLLPRTLPLAPSTALARAVGCTLLVADDATFGAAGLPAVLPATALAALRERHADTPSRLSGDQHPADGVQCARDGLGACRVVLRPRSPERLVLLAATVGDLLARVALVPGGVHLLGPLGDRPEPQFWAGVTLVTGGSVVTLTDPSPEAMLRALAGHGVTSTVLQPAQLRALLALPAALTDEADLTALQRVLVDGPGVDVATVAAATDLFGEDVLQHVYAPAHTGPVAHTGRVLTGVTVTAGAGGELHVRSPLTADGAVGDAATRGSWPAPPAWHDTPVPTGDAGSVTADGTLVLRSA